MTNGKLKVLSAAALVAVAGAVQAAVSQPRHVTIEYEYAKDGEIVSRKVNGAEQRYEYDLRGQLTGVYDVDGKAVEAYQYDAAGNILRKTVNGKTTTFKYDAANQLVSKEDDAGLVTYAYDAAGRMIREGGKEYRYSYLDKITSVLENGETAATMDYFVGGQLASVTRGNEAERFIWDGLALVHRDGSDYLNEPAVGGGNPVASNGKVMLNDMLGSTVAVKGDEGLGMTSMTAFGESGDPNAFFTGKPFIGEIGYAFLMRSYRPENGKWQTADPMGYPDGWNNLAYCNNGVTSSVDLWGCALFTNDGSGNMSLNRELYYDDPVQFASEMAGLYWAVGVSAAAEGAINDPSVYNMSGFWHWLNGSGTAVVLGWTAFDNNYEVFNGLLVSFVTHLNRIVGSLGHGDSIVGWSASTSARSHNAWISSYQASVTCTSSIFENGSWFITAEFRAWDRSDFNPGGSFAGPGGTYFDDDFIWLRDNTVWGGDFDISSKIEMSWIIRE